MNTQTESARFLALESLLSLPSAFENPPARWGGWGERSGPRESQRRQATGAASALTNPLSTAASHSWVKAHWAKAPHSLAKTFRDTQTGAQRITPDSDSAATDARYDGRQSLHWTCEGQAERNRKTERASEQGREGGRDERESHVCRWIN